MPDDSFAFDSARHLRKDNKWRHANDKELDDLKQLRVWEGEADAANLKRLLEGCVAERDLLVDACSAVGRCAKQARGWYEGRCDLLAYWADSMHNNFTYRRPRRGFER